MIIKNTGRSKKMNKEELIERVIVVFRALSYKFIKLREGQKLLKILKDNVFLMRIKDGKTDNVLFIDIGVRI